MLRELITRPISMLNAVLDLPRTMERSVRQANELMDVSQEQLETMRQRADEALAQAERMNDLLARLVKLTEPLEKAQRGGEFVSEQLKKVLLGEENEAVTRGGSADARGLREEPPLSSDEEPPVSGQATAKDAETEAKESAPER